LWRGNKEIKIKGDREKGGERRKHLVKPGGKEFRKTNKGRLQVIEKERNVGVHRTKSTFNKEKKLGTTTWVL